MGVNCGPVIEAISMVDEILQYPLKSYHRHFFFINRNQMSESYAPCDSLPNWSAFECLDDDRMISFILLNT